MFVKTVVLQICSKFTEHPSGSAISIKLVCNFTEITLRHGIFLCICCIFAENIMWRTPMGDCFWICNVIKLVKIILESLWYFAYLNYPLLPNLFFYNWCKYLIFMYEISKCWEWIVVYNHEKKCSKLFGNSSGAENNMGWLFLKHPVLVSSLCLKVLILIKQINT